MDFLSLIYQNLSNREKAIILWIILILIYTQYTDRYFYKTILGILKIVFWRWYEDIIFNNKTLPHLHCNLALQWRLHYKPVKSPVFRSSLLRRDYSKNCQRFVAVNRLFLSLLDSQNRMIASFIKQFDKFHMIRS